MSTEKNQTTQSKSLTISQTTILLCFFCITLGIFHLNGPFRVIFYLSVNIHPCMCACYRPSRGDIVIGATAELKVSPQKSHHKFQLIACMEKLSAELALKAVKAEKIFSQIIIYGMLVDCQNGDTIVGKLTMDFISHRSTLIWSRESVGFNECLLKVRKILENE